ncbi:PilN domain-containing protein [Tatumella saanichensis]|uniref:PilN domain-containing protein n=1 Tax=Tatumella saanichensis TaxID=480813 RepID=UPI0004A33419|nr:PilN domain-containing protein [Tatumella saanichensis]
MNQANLLPWREGQLRRRGYLWLLRLGGMLLTVLLTIAIARRLLALSGQQFSLHLAQQQQGIAAVEQLLQQQQQLSSLSAANAMQQQASEQVAIRAKQWGLFWESLPQWLPPSVWLTSVARQGTTLTFTGESESVGPLQATVSTLRQQVFFTRVVISELTRGDTGAYRFILTTQLGRLLSPQREVEEVEEVEDA